MKVSDLIHTVEKSDAFQSWHNTFPHAFLAHIYFEESDYQIGYFDAKTENITTFFVKSNIVVNHEESPIFKKPETTLEKLDFHNVKLTPEEAIALGEKIQKEYYSHEHVFKAFLILQHLDIGQVYNLTFVTQSMKTINLKISAEKGNVIKQHVESLMDMAKVE